MAFRRFLKEANPAEIRKMLWLTLIAGCANAFLIVVINQVAVLVSDAQRPTWLEVLTFLAAFILYYVCNKKALLGANTIIEKLLKDLRVNIADKLRQ